MAKMIIMEVFVYSLTYLNIREISNRHEPRTEFSNNEQKLKTLFFVLLEKQTKLGEKN